MIQLASAVTVLDSSTVLNTSESNTSLTFSIPINVTDVTISPTDILLTGIICSNGADIPYTTVLFNAPNTNFDSGVYCTFSGLQTSCSGIVGMFTSTVAIIGLLLTIILIAAVVTLLLTSFNVMPNAEFGESMDLKTVLYSIVIIAIVAILVILVIYIFGSGFCPAFGG